MQQYFENREKESFKKLIENKDGENKIIENKVYVNERPDKNWNSNNYIVHNSTFAKMGFREAKFNDDDLKFNVFIDCYFKRAKFNNVNFTGSLFINCNFDEVTLINCVFDYCKFENCIIQYKYLKESLAERANIRWEICKNMSLECLKLGQENEYRKYFFEEKKASETYYLKKFWHKGSDTYYKKYNGVDQLTGFVDYVLSKLNKLLWGYGEMISRLIINIVIVLGMFTVGYYMSVDVVGGSTKMTIPIALYISISNFFTVTCSYISDESIYKVLSIAEGGVGIVLMGFFVAALFRFINRRG